jgi:hypothetical protein
MLTGIFLYYYYLPKSVFLRNERKNKVTTNLFLFAFEIMNERITTKKRHRKLFKSVNRIVVSCRNY